MELAQCRCWSVLFVGYVVCSWFAVGRPWTLVSVVVGQCVGRWLLCYSSFVVRSWFVVGSKWTLVNFVVIQCVVRWLLCHLSFVVGSLVDHGPWSMSLLLSVLFLSCYVIRRS